MKKEAEVIWKFKYLSERLLVKGYQLNAKDNCFEIESSMHCMNLFTLDAVEGYLLCMEKYSISDIES